MHTNARRPRADAPGRDGIARVVAGAVAVGLALALVPVTGATRAAATDHSAAGSSTGARVYATGAHQDAAVPDIAWITWAGENETVTDGTTVTNWHELGDDAWLEVTCTLSDLTSGGPVTAYAPRANSWENPDGTVGRSTDGLGQLYPGMPPAGVRQVVDDDTTTFTVSCDAEVVRYDEQGRAGGNRIGSDPVELGGLVFAEPESLNQGPGPNDAWMIEHVKATAASAASPWRVIDRYQGACAGQTHTATVDIAQEAAGWSARLFNESVQCGDGSATAVLLAQDVDTLDVELVGQGFSAAAVGYVLGVDHGDAPESYGVAGAVVRPTWSGGELPPGRTRLAGTVCDGACYQVGTAVATRGAPDVSLGADVRANTTVPFSADATADVPDEDAFGAGGSPAAVEVEPAVAPYTLATARCRGSGAHVAAWLDWDGNGTYDDDERSDTVACPGGSAAGDVVTLTWSQVPADTRGGTSFLRLRASTDPADLASATGPAVAGDVEDWQVQILATQLTVAKSADVPYLTDGTGTVAYTVTLRNTGNVAFTHDRPAYVVDDLTGALPYATLGEVTASTGTASVTADRITWSGPLDVGASVTLTYRMTVTQVPGTAGAAMRNVAVGSATPPAAGPLGCEPASQAAGLCASVDLVGLGLTVDKTAAADGAPLDDGARLTPGTPVTWTYVVTNTGSVPLRDVSVVDLVTETRDGSPLVTDDPAHLDCGAHGAGTDVVLGELAAGEQVTCTATRQVVPRP
ncbi:CshA/CshB family fibrillar adhesin-related protein [Cellulomonas shaoxiangyii]|uniref:Uncharacterized protein n=1 Tax=Cellulomonas shaoxiangyii TaxID=2566013 RepID=A0A4P7SHZ5_9CELL|nr:CshA/CshB family fibrillar adhesin-related protein [Cellulomonas shaoxiangyii]QCB93859.1 hypothetical protein E5225_10110 [Cellulomonas shaoxiangyii]TGY84582.1 hypothetical protein E5226_10550 [Cellulomonas shaoxiangyii]